jgi:hypothetical protein
MGRTLDKADDPSVEEFISLCRLNQHLAILIDSDKSSVRERINETKKRICEEFNRDDMPGFAWITGCRTIENYVPLEVLNAAAVAAVHTRSNHQPPLNQWADPLDLTSATSSRKSGQTETSTQRGRPDKVKIARHACGF